MGKKERAFSNLLWRFAERTGAQGVTFVVSIILARLLDPSVYGTIALITVFTTVLQVFVDSGLGNALIQKKDADNIDFSSVFFFNLAVCLGLYLLLFLCAPLIAKFYGLPELTSVIRVMGLTLVISGIKNIQQAYVSRHLLFRKFFFATLGGTLGAAVLGIYMAWRGYGVWALVVQNIFNQTIDTIILWLTVKWRPQAAFSFERLNGLLSYGWKLLAASLIDTIYNDLRQLVIGKVYSSSDLAFYNQGNKFPQLIVANIVSSVNSVLLPVMSAEQGHREHIRKMTQTSIQVSTYIMAPLMLGLAACAPVIVKLILTEKWLPCVLYLRIFCISYLFYPIHTSNLSAIKAVGRSDLFLKLEIIKKVIGLIALFVTMPISVEAMAYSLLFTSVSSQIINSWPNKKLLNYSYLEQLKDILPSILLAVFMGFCVSFLSLLELPDIVTLPLQILCGAAIYVIGSRILKLESFTYLLGVVKSCLHRKKN